MEKQCETCVSRRCTRGGLSCSLGLDKYLNKGEKCGSYGNSKFEIDDFEYEYDGIHIDRVNEIWLDGEL